MIVQVNWDEVIVQVTWYTVILKVTWDTVIEQETGRDLVMVQNITDYSYVDMIIITTLSHSLT